MGAVLAQAVQPLAFLSTALKHNAVFLSTYENELLALVTTMRKWKPYLLSSKFLLEQRVGTVVQQKWVCKLMGYDFLISNTKGKEYLVANVLSRKGEEGDYFEGSLAMISFTTLGLILRKQRIAVVPNLAFKNRYCTTFTIIPLGDI